MDDNEIIELLYQRSEYALVAVKIKFYSYCRRIAIEILHNNEDADECFNETLFKVWKAIPPARPKNLAAYLGRIIQNIALDRNRAMHSQKRGGGVVEIPLEELQNITIAETADNGEITRAFIAFLNSESPEHRDIFDKRYLRSGSIKSIAAEYGYSKNKVASLLYRMRKRLRKKLKSEGLLE